MLHRSRARRGDGRESLPAETVEASSHPEGVLPVSAAGLALFISAVVGFQGVASLDRGLSGEDPASLARAAREQGDPARGAAVFHRPYFACVKCHEAGEGGNPLGPDLAKTDKGVTDEYLIESILSPSKEIKKGYEPIAIATADGRTVTGLLAEERPDAIVLRDPSQDGRLVTVAKKDIEERAAAPQSIMPPGLANLLASRQEFLDLVRYLREIADGGPRRALETPPRPLLDRRAPLARARARARSRRPDRRPRREEPQARQDDV